MAVKPETGPEHPKDTPKYPGTPLTGWAPEHPLLQKIGINYTPPPPPKKKKEKLKIINESINIFDLSLENGDWVRLTNSRHF